MPPSTSRSFERVLLVIAVFISLFLVGCSLTWLVRRNDLTSVIHGDVGFPDSESGISNALHNSGSSQSSGQ